ncbi:MAG: NFACT family protein [Proteobacteria bacterium]|nr:NFACT family protein [Pseudomonadota bacterium]
MHATELQAVFDELQRLVGQHRGQVWQPSRGEVVIEIGGERLLISPGGAFPRVHTITRRPKQPKRPFSFQGALRAHLGPRLTRLAVIGGDRVCELEFGDAVLHIRLFGRGRGVLLVNNTPVSATDGPTPAELPPLPPVPGPPRPPRFSPQGDESWDDAARRWFGERVATTARNNMRTGIRRRLVREVKRTRRLVRALASDLDAAERAPILRAQADVLACNLHQLTRGQDHAVLPSLEQPGTNVEIRLDTKLSPAENMNRLYKKAGRLERSGERVLERLDTEENRLADLSAKLEGIEDADLPALRALDKLLPKQGRGAAPTKRVPWDTWLGPGGMRLRVGHNAAANRKLCFSVSRGRDWWLHLRDRPGAHVVLALGGAQSPPLEALLAGAQLVLIAARIPEGTAADVQYTEIRHLRPIPGESGGRVRVAEERVLRVQRDRSALHGWDKQDQV